MRVECPACGQRIEVTGRQMYCPNCGQLCEVSHEFQPPLPPRQKPQAPATDEFVETLEDVTPRGAYVRPQRVEPQEPPPRPAPFVPPPPPPDREFPAWLPATFVILALFVGLFVILYIGSMKLASYSPPPPPPPPPVAPPPTPAPPPPQQGSKLFSYNNAPTTPPPPVAPPPPPPPVATTTPIEKTNFVVAPVPIPKDVVTDDAINNAIAKGVAYLVSRFNSDFTIKVDGAQQPGAHALCTLALMHAGQAIADEKLNIHSPFMIGLIEKLKGYAVPQGMATYTRSLRAQALSVYDRKEDRSVLAADVRWLTANCVKGAYTYYEPPSTATQPTQFGWDNSNSQYGALGVWAAEDANIIAPPSYWMGVQAHWEQSQNKNGSWDYSGGGQGNGTLSMTAAGVNMLFVANESLSALRPDTQVARPPFSPSLQKGLDWLADGDHSVDTSGPYTYYTLYGMERAGLACGFKMFGRHDWFRELAAHTIVAQGTNGEWNNEVDTAFALLFLSRGRHPLMMNKLHFIGAWANRPRDVAHLAKFTTKETERPLNWQVVSLSNEWGDWTDSPILYLASHEAPIMDENDFEKLRSYVMAGGLLFTQADGGSAEFNQFAELLAQKLFGKELTDLPPDHFIYNALFRPKEKFPIKAVSNGTRLLMIHCSDDIAKRWQTQSPKNDRVAFELGGNLFVYVTGQDIPRNRLDALYVPDSPGVPSATVPIARLKHGGDWDPEPYAWERESRLFRRETNIKLQPTPIDIEKLSTADAPVAHLTSSGALALTEPQISTLRNYVTNGGVLVIDPCGGAKPVRDSVRELARKIIPDKQPTDIHTDHPLLAGKGDGLTQIAKPQVRPYVFKVIGSKYPLLQMIESGKGALIVAEMDLTSGLLGIKTLGIVGYDSAYAHAFVRNVILWTINGRGPVTPWNKPGTMDAATQPASAPANATPVITTQPT